MSRADAVAILPAAGKGTRLGEAKQFLELGGVPLLVRAVERAAACSEIAAIVIAAPPGEEERVRDLLAAHGADAKLHAVVAGGAERADSVKAALRAAPAGLPMVAIHDAARPFATPELFTRVLEAARRTGAAVAALPCTDTVKRLEGSGVTTVDRRSLWLAQTPQCFRIEQLLRAYERAGNDVSVATDEAALIEALGEPVELVPGEKENFKVTDADDLRRARGMVEAPAAVGFGFDVHAFEEGRRCVLGGVEFPGETGLAGHSDADAALHAIMDAILGAAGLGDIGQHFPDTDARFRGADSGVLLQEVAARAKAAGFRVQNVDLTIAAARPRIGPRREEMRAKIASILGIPEARVNVKATTTEGLGFVGRSEGIAAQAVALLAR
ncbi:2-C-methyl-D-erythritol 4-phosphate cytidylyltransferase [Vulgatibacter incomptus]|uniref:Bifunctional enzyme IspD/IspF n=1 Tax=Vulgatibacter incomptus TaxID=1391653 RepID=A0A0K1PBF3_9BACT|nr:2-C-methyl-D-erythritol 4-phosphate cytidylyltransferase [Vulgatibacter incomptus]AKU90731.1 2-C-methyl-D-erythritol 2,4-cyclodiphosphate synthase [Vulgatibacter incomptus]